MLITAVSTRIDFIKTHGELRDSVDQMLLSWLSDAGVLPVPTPNILNANNTYKWLKKISPTSIVLSGGNDIGEFSNRDETEKILIRYALEMGLPLFGICRGMQMVSLFFGSQIKKVNCHVGTRHFVDGDISGEVNSFHNFGINSCPDQFRVLCKSLDGEIEAIRNDKLKWECWMWHPERETNWKLEHLNRARKILAGEAI